MRLITVAIKNSKTSDPKVLNVINRMKAYCYSFGIEIKILENTKTKHRYKLDFDASGLSADDVKKYSSICSQISSLFYFSETLWDLTRLESRPSDAVSEIYKTKKLVSQEKELEKSNYFKAILDFYDQTWYLREIIGRSEYLPEDRINWKLNKSELAALKALILQIRDKVEVSGIEWTMESAIASVDAFLTASIKYPLTREFKKHFSLRVVNSSFVKIYRHVRTQIKPTGATNNSSHSNSQRDDELDRKFDSYFADNQPSK